MESRRLFLPFVIVFLVAAACGDGDSQDTTTTTVAETTTTTEPTTTTTTEPTTTTPPLETTTTEATTTTTVATTATTETTTTTVDTNALAEGSGCTPGTPDTLPDGRWFGFVADGGADAILFDLACWFVGDAAVLAAAEDSEESPPPNDYYIRNANPDLRALPVVPDTMVTWYPSEGDPTSEDVVPFEDWLVARSGEYPLGVWVTTEDGRIVAIDEQWVP